jgi:hypothetical protein
VGIRIATSGDEVYIWGAQLVLGAVPGDYQATTTAALPVLYADYNGALRARKLCEDATAAAPHRIFQGPTTVGTSSLSIVAKAAERNWIYLRFIDASATIKQGWFNLATGTLGTIESGMTGSIQSAGNGYYRCTFSGPALVGVNTTLFGVTNADAIAAYTGDGSSGIYIADAQLNDGSSALAYYDTSATLTYAPRLDYNPVTLQPRGLLIEESRQNLLTYSEQFDNAAWNKNSITVTSNAVIAPDGTLTADKVISNVGVFGTVSQAPTVVVSSTYTYSIYAKAAEFSWLRAQVNLITGTRVAWFNLASGSVGTVQAGLTASIVSAGNGFYRCIVAAIADNTNGSFVPGATSADNSNTNGDGVSGIYIWGAQVEQGAFASSYIPTVGSQLTRAADVASVNTLSPWFSQPNGTLYIEADTFEPSSLVVKNAVAINDGSSVNMHRVLSYFGKIGGNTVVASVNSADLQPYTYTVNTPFKFAYAYATNNFAAVGNGGAPSTDPLGALPTGLTVMGVGNLSGVFWNGYIRRITYYPQRLTNAQLQSITA